MYFEQNEIDIKYIKGIGEKRARLFKKRLGLFTLRDLITFYPRDYEDWSSPYKICDAPIEQTVCISAEIASEIEQKQTRNKNIVTYTFYIYDRTGQIKVVIFNNKYLAETLKKGQTYLFYGRLKWNGNFRQMDSPEIRPESYKIIRPVYHATGGLTSRQIESIMHNVLQNIGEYNILPQEIIKSFNLMQHTSALKQIHFPSTPDSLCLARQTLIFEELLLLRLGFFSLKNRSRTENAFPLVPVSIKEIKSLFNFELTNAQINAINECIKDISSARPMNRLLQGDVGCGKTAVAAALCYIAAKNGKQAIMLAPTEILATQHYNNIIGLFNDKNIKTALLTGSLTPKQKRVLKEQIKNKEFDIIIGTHALLTKDVEVPDTALVITDEQHRFGVGQRAVLGQKGVAPHKLVMSATPIPRTMALTVYGDLDVSIINELPKGRIPCKSYMISPKLRARAINFVKKHLEQGFQGYVVCPAIDYDETTALKAATDYAEDLKNGQLSDFNIGLLHGKMKPKEKDSVMQRFASGEIQLLVSTTVIEVGVDVPNAVIMVVENAERFGLSQLHQLRGRVGRGNTESTCIFICCTSYPQTVERIKTLCKTTNGFEIAEADLKQRGPGNFLGREQHGLPRLKIADMARDSDILLRVSTAADRITVSDPEFTKPEHAEIKRAINDLFCKDRNIEFN